MLAFIIVAKIDFDLDHGIHCLQQSEVAKNNNMSLSLKKKLQTQ